MTLYEMTQDYLNLLAMAEDPETNEQAFIDTLEGIEGEIEIKADGYARVIKQLEANVNAYDTELKRIKEKKNACENNIKRMKKHLTDAMVTIDKRKFKTDLFSFNVQKNPVAVKLNEGVNPAELPDEYTKITREENKTAIKQAIEAGIVIDFAYLEQTEGVRIR